MEVFEKNQEENEQASCASDSCQDEYSSCCDTGCHFRANLKKYAHPMVAYIQDNPLKSTLMASAFGFLLGRFLYRKMRS